MNRHVLLSDPVHFNVRNFDVLLAHLENGPWISVVNQTHVDLIARYGDYSQDLGCLQPYLKMLNAECSEEGLLDFQYRNIPVFPAIKAELLSYIIPKYTLFNGDISGDDECCFAQILAVAKQDLHLNYAAFMLWVDHWHKALEKVGSGAKVFVFNGGCLYARALLELCRRRENMAFVFEQSFTGHQYYMEERYSPIANHSAIGDTAYYRALDIASASEQMQLNARAHQRMQAMRNKNVQQPQADVPIEFAQKAPVALLLAQVVNDFSLLCSDLSELCSLSWYRHLIAKLMAESDYNLIIKTHPWEQHKTHLKANVSAEALQSFVDRHGWTERVRIVSDHNLYALFAQTAVALTLNSQSAIEAAYHGLKPIQLGQAFYGGKGFTYDCQEVDEVMALLSDPSFDGLLSLPEYECLEQFLSRYLCLHLHTNHQAEARRIDALMAGDWLSAAQSALNSRPVADTSLQPSTGAVSLAERANNISERAEAVASRHGRTRRLMQKMIRNPRKFCLDSPNPLLRRVASIGLKRGV